MKSRYASADTDLTTLANQLDLLAFELSEGDVLKFQELSETHTLQNVALYLGGRTFRVRLCVGGRQHVIGITRNGPNAARYADMARLFFWPYRLRDKRLPEDWEFNYGLQATQHELDCNENAVRVLEKIRDHLISISRLTVMNPEVGAESAGKEYSRQARRTMRGELLFIHEESMGRAHALEATLEGLEKALSNNVRDNANAFDQCKQAFQHILEQLCIADHRVKVLEDLNRRALFGSPLERLDYTPCLDSEPKPGDNKPL